ncbi:hypothetical protein [Streptomyces sp. NPDC058751]|uniref:hypothetical protein n=1 Tax=Streptomyces sp. NPDC058751 TaxID=3346623 RepID=UPI00369A808E
MAMVSGGAVPADDPNGDPDEHVRFARYRRAFAEVAPADAAALVARVLTDPDKGMANSAVCEYLDRRAAELLTDPGYPSWCLEMAGPVAVDDFSARRLDEWTLLRVITLSEPWDAEDLLAASDRLQLHTSENSSAVTALEVLAESGRTRRIRNIAKSRLPAARRPIPDAERVRPRGAEPGLSGVSGGPPWTGPGSRTGRPGSPGSGGRRGGTS